MIFGLQFLKSNLITQIHESTIKNALSYSPVDPANREGELLK